jgi:hypothetical protein
MVVFQLTTLAANQEYSATTRESAGQQDRREGRTYVARTGRVQSREIANEYAWWAQRGNYYQAGPAYSSQTGRAQRRYNEQAIYWQGCYKKTLIFSNNNAVLL